MHIMIRVGMMNAITASSDSSLFDNLSKAHTLTRVRRDAVTDSGRASRAPPIFHVHRLRSKFASRPERRQARRAASFVHLRPEPSPPDASASRVAASENPTIIRKDCPSQTVTGPGPWPHIRL